MTDTSRSPGTGKVRLYWYLVPSSTYLTAGGIKHQRLEPGARTIVCREISLELVNSIRSEPKPPDVLNTAGGPGVSCDGTLPDAVEHILGIETVSRPRSAEHAPRRGNHERTPSVSDFYGADSAHAACRPEDRDKEDAWADHVGVRSAAESYGLPVPDTDVEIVDPDTAEEVPQGEVGEIWIRGPQVMKGYWPTPGSGLEPAGWLRTGDLARMDDDGYFHVVDRIEVDEFLFKHPAVAGAVTIGVPVPHRPGSERVKSLIVLEEDLNEAITEKE